MLGGGALMVLGSLLDWRGFRGAGTSGVSFDSMGLFGILVLLIGLGLVAIGAIRAFGLSVDLPDNIAGFSLNQLALIEAFAVFLWSFALISADFIKVGVHLTWIGGAAAVAGAILAQREATPSTTA